MQPPPPPVDDVSDLVGRLLLHTEELRAQIKAAPRPVPVDLVLYWPAALEDLLPLLDALHRRVLDATDGVLSTDDATQSTEGAMWQACQAKVLHVAQLLVQTVTKDYHEPVLDETKDDSQAGIDHAELLKQGQGAVARLVELYWIILAVSSSSSSSSDDTASNQLPSEVTDSLNSYVQYQRTVLRQRSKPVIAQLVAYRRRREEMGNKNVVQGVQHYHDSDDEDNEDKNVVVVQQHYGPVLAHILGHAAALMHPLLVWHQQLPPPDAENNDMVTRAIRQMTTDALRVLDEQTGVLVQTVTQWFGQDEPIEKHLQQSAAEPTDAVMQATQLGALDGLVEEMGFTCHLQARYVALVATADETIGERQALAQSIEKELLPEWTWKYASLERYLAVQQWQSALAVCQPVQIVLGLPIQVPSVVEDAQFLSTRALERAATTRSAQALGTVAHAVSHDIWSTDSEGTMTVYQALLEQRGCWSGTVIEKGTTPHSTSKTNSLSQTSSHHSSPERPKLDFASALMDAVDEDLVQSAARTPKAPSSGGLFGISLGDSEAVLQMQIDVKFCVMNGAHASAAACRSLVEYLDSLLASDSDALDMGQSTSTSMVSLTREELFRYAGDYEKLFKAQIQTSLTEFAGGTGAPRSRLALDQIYDFFVKENFAIDASEMKILEDEERLLKELDERFTSSMFLSQISQKAESPVAQLIGEELVETVTQVVWKALITPERKVTDWGALLFWKEIGRLQNLVATALASDQNDQPPVFAWARLSQVATVLQLESPSEWLMYRSSTSVLTKDELEQAMRLRVDFSVDAIRTVLAS